MNAKALWSDGSSVTPEREIQACLDAIRERWNARIPRKRFLKWTPLRIADARAALRMWTLPDVLAAIDLYAQGQWQRANGHRAIDTWLTLPIVTEWCERAALAAEVADWREPPQDARVAKATEDVAEKLRVRREDEVLLAAFADLPATRRNAIFDQAADEIVAVGGRRLTGRHARSLDTHLIRQHVLMILRRQP